MSESPETLAPVETPAPDGVAPSPAPAPAADTSDAPSEGSVPVEGEPDAPKDEPSSDDAPSDVAAGDSEPIDPASYEFTLPEAFTADASLEAAAREAFAANGVPKEAAQPLVDLFTQTLAAQADSAQKAFEKQQAAWSSEINAMPEFKEGPTREKALASIGRLIDTYGDAGVKDALNMYGIGNNPALAKFFARVAAELDEGGASAAPRGPANVSNNKSQSGVRGQHLTYPNTPTQ